MAVVLNTNKPYNGRRKLIDLSSAYLDPETLFDAHKARVIADGGTVPREAALLSEIQFLVNNGMWSRIGAYCAPDWGVKQDGSGNVTKLYGLGNSPDFVAVTVAGESHPMTLDTSGTRTAVNIVLSNGGRFLQSASVIKLQNRTNDLFLFSVLLRDNALADNAGIAVGFGTASSTLSFAESRQTVGGISNPWKYTCTNKIPVVAGSYVAATQVPYADFVPSAGLFDPANGKVFGYQGGIVAQTGVSSTGTLADISSQSAYVFIGPTYLNATTGLNAVNGAIACVRSLITAYPDDAELISSRA